MPYYREWECPVYHKHTKPQPAPWEGNGSMVRSNQTSSTPLLVCPSHRTKLQPRLGAAIAARAYVLVQESAFSCGVAETVQVPILIEHCSQ